jgi:hypothetical protein
LIRSDQFQVSEVESEIDGYHYEYGMRRERERYLAHPTDVADCAEQIARRYCGMGRKGVATAHTVVFPVVAGRCVYAMDKYGMSFIHLARLTCIDVAKLVGAVSADLRENSGPCHDEHVQRIHSCSDLAQIVKFSEIVAAADQLARDLELDPARASEEREDILCWLRYQGDLLDTLKASLFADRKFAKPVEIADRLLEQTVYSRIRRPRSRGIAHKAHVSPSLPAPVFSTYLAEQEPDVAAWEIESYPHQMEVSLCS